jgi:tetratricopeptide (TPR) repeat protein
LHQHIIPVFYLAGSHHVHPFMRVVCTITILLALFTNELLRAQGIVFEKGNWASAVAKAKKQKKLLFLQFDNPTCGSCDVMTAQAFNSPLVREKFAQHFISFRIDGTAGLGRELANKLAVECTPSSVYLDTDENPLARYCGATSFDRAYLEKAEEAIVKNRQRPMASFSEAYAKGERSSTFMRNYITRRRETGLSVQELLDDYVTHLPQDSLRSADLLRFVFEQGPVVGSKPDSIFRSQYFRVDSLYKAVGWNKAIELNNRITNNSLRKAICEKNSLLARRTADFRRRTYQNNYKAGRAAQDWVMMRYYRETQDTLRYLRQASAYYDAEFMTARVDSIQKLDELDMQRRMRGETTGTAPSGPPSSNGSFAPYPNTQRYVSALNQAAWDFQALTRDSTYLQKALSWSKRSLEYRQDGSLLDTYAHILYRLGRKDEALTWQRKAINKEKERNSPFVAPLEATLKKMQTGTL